MDREQEYLLKLLGAFLRREVPEVWQELDWKKLMGQAYIHNISGILGYMAMTYPICPDGETNAALRRMCLDTIMRYANQGAMVEELSRLLAQKGIDHILMKGFILREYYPVPELRTFGDIDIVIRPGDRAKCDSLMREQGFQAKADWEPVFSYIRPGEYYEIHTEIMEVDVSDKADYRGYFREMWVHAVPMGECRYQFEPEFHFLYMMTHIAKHVTGSGAGIRMYLDVAAFLRHFGGELDWDYVRQELKTLVLADFANVVLTLVRDCFGVESPIPLKPVKEETLADFLEFTMNGGIFGRVGRDSGINSLKNQSRAEGETSRVSTLTRRLFPSAKSIETRYTYLQDKPWLLPAAWVHRLIKTRASWNQHTQEARNILSADKDTVQKINRLYREIGL
ncbi:MAG: nucleotidyltransferase family protein [Oscillospiraceae bacterium]|nr:nucleotidyltransferase family protein [Oscillospiraceae bacterium]